MSLLSRLKVIEAIAATLKTEPHIVFLDSIEEQEEVAQREAHRALLILVEQSHGASIWRFGKLVDSNESAATGTH